MQMFSLLQVINSMVVGNTLPPQPNRLYCCSTVYLHCVKCVCLHWLKCWFSLCLCTNNCGLMFFSLWSCHKCFWNAEQKTNVYERTKKWAEVVKKRKNSVLAKKMSCLEKGTQNLRECKTFEKRKFRFFCKKSKYIKLSSVRRIRLRIKVISWIRIRIRIIFFRW